MVWPGVNGETSGGLARVGYDSSLQVYGIKEYGMAKWLCKTEPSECSIDDFANAPGKAIVWEGVRNYQARNFMRQMALGDEILIYHSSCAQIGVAGVVKVVKTAYPDPA